MFNPKFKLLAILGLAFVSAAIAAGSPTTDTALTGKAEALVHNMAKGDFSAAEANFTVQMKQAAPPQKLQQIWNALVVQGGAFQKTTSTKTIREGGYTSVIVNTEFTRQTVGLAITFDNSGKIGGLHLLPAV